jgi:nucleolar GTP-binding protein
LPRLNPFANIPAILTAEEIIEYAHNKSSRISMKSSLRMKREDRSRIREIQRLQEFTRLVKTKLNEAVEGFPSIDRLHPFYLELTEILIGKDKLKQSLGAVHKCIPPIDEITYNHIEALKLTSDFRQMKKTRSAAKGRISSILRATATNLDFIIEAKRVLSQLPGIAPNIPSIVCAGFPNVGKSTLVKSVSTAEPEIAYYPFTTRKLIIGHLKVSSQNLQIVDTPGILDRPMGERNDIELQAVAALKYLANVIIFMIDPSEACGWSLKQQLNLFGEVQRMFPLTPILVVLNKIDITPDEQLEAARESIPGAYEIVAINQTGVEQLLRNVLEEIDLKPMQEKIDEYLESLSRE